MNWLILNFSFFSFSWLFGILTGLPISPGKPCSPITVLAGDHLTRPLPLWSPFWCIWLLISDSSTYKVEILGLCKIFPWNIISNPYHYPVLEIDFNLIFLEMMKFMLYLFCGKFESFMLPRQFTFTTAFEANTIKVCN